eukprot:CAMPEP_0181188384 /NCGR_PEP_ID=MMETSP1096-20121128/11084_1 /TAXON_ID=156174 ORGANISM="Chrysochromulina ericina, Strain CCMP281" /NCGR_SAMPLE_ID=MMETSP1096 /ASSEMBLY_ACC=CAM_ASM_000453 /LENGTH=42 /DNA_ID= /DNA_START= /DNA_END= /DNA_ORIENTATION=
MASGRATAPPSLLRITTPPSLLALAAACHCWWSLLRVDVSSE